MDLSMKRIEPETFEYRHKKFDHVRSSPVTVQLKFEEESCHETRHIAENSDAYAQNYDLYKATQEAVKQEEAMRALDWSNELDAINTPRTPTRNRRMSKRKINAAYHEICNAPKKRKIEEPITPKKTKDSIHTAKYFMPQISKEALSRICQYNKNMVRQFPKKERSPKEQERRDKNTIACRMSRRLKKLEHLAVEEQYKMFVHEHFEQERHIMQSAYYLNELIMYGAQVPYSEENHEIVENIAKKLDLKFLANIPTNEVQWKLENFYENQPEAQSINDAKNRQEQKRPFTIEFLLGSE